MTKKDEIGDFWDLDALIEDFNPQDLLIEDFTLDVAPTDLEIENLDFNLLGFCANSSPKKKKKLEKRRKFATSTRTQ